MDYKNMPHSVKALLQWAVLFLGKEKRIEAELLLAKACQYSRAKLLAYPEKELIPEQIKQFVDSVRKRQEGYPLQYLTGIQSFMGLDFKVTEDVLIPRSDTEVLVEEVLRLSQQKPKNISILDLCTGSGAIAISLAKYINNSRVLASDISENALDIARYNAISNGFKHKVEFRQGDLFTPLKDNDKFDFIVSNPPYISSQEMKELPNDVQKEPQLALWGGNDGLDFYRKITSQAPQYLLDGGYLLMEIGYLQGQTVQSLCQASGFAHCQILKDWSGNDRVVLAGAR